MIEVPVIMALSAVLALFADKAVVPTVPRFEDYAFHVRRLPSLPGLEGSDRGFILDVIYLESKVGNFIATKDWTQKLMPECQELIAELAAQNNMPNPEKVYMMSVSLNHDHQSMRLGRLAYQLLGGLVWREHRTFIVSGNCYGNTSEDAERVWLSLQRDHTVLKKTVDIDTNESWNPGNADNYYVGRVDLDPESMLEWPRP